MPEKEYIEREEALRQMRESKTDKPKYGDWDIAHDCCIDIVEKTPTADVAEVVRCEKCQKSYKRSENSKLNFYWCRKWNNIIRATDFCSFGERKTDD